MVTTLNACAQLPGRRFYRYYLEDLNRRFNDFGETTEAKIGERNIRFACPNLLTRWRVETLRSKEPATLDWIDGFSPGDTLWDVGANIGIYSIYAAVARACRVVAFEPSPVNFALLERNIVLNGLSEKIVAFPVALCESQRIDLLNMANMDAGAAFASFGGRTSQASVRIACLGYPLDNFVDEFAPPFPQHLKIDVDGNEEAILHGALDGRLQIIACAQSRSKSMTAGPSRSLRFKRPSGSLVSAVQVHSGRRCSPIRRRRISISSALWHRWLGGLVLAATVHVKRKSQRAWHYPGRLQVKRPVTRVNNYRVLSASAPYSAALTSASHSSAVRHEL